MTPREECEDAIRILDRQLDEIDREETALRVRRNYLIGQINQYKLALSRLDAPRTNAPRVKP